MKAAFFCGSESAIDNVYRLGRRQRVGELCELHPVVVTPENLAEQLPELAELEVIFSTWGMFAPSDEQLARLGQLKAVFYAAGSVQRFARPFLARGIQVFSAWAANAIPVAEFTVAQILLANKGYFRNIQDCASPETRSNAFASSGNFDETVSLLGAGMIGKKVIELLSPFHLHVLVFDPFLADDDAARLGVEKVNLEDAFERGLVVSNHLANLPATQGMLEGRHFESMRQNAVFINTGRGATTVESELVRALQNRPDLTALLDVTDPEPPTADSPFYQLPNAIISSHIAGAINQEVARMADYMLEEFQAWRADETVRFNVTLEMLDTMA